MRVLYVQFTDPAGYPPLEHSSRIFAKAGHEVLFLGTATFKNEFLEFPPHPKICIKRLLPSAPPGWRQKVLYLRFILWSLWWAVCWRPRLVYASDLLSCPPVLLMSFLPLVRVLYHEHDSPHLDNADGQFQRLLLWVRFKLAHRAAACVLPNERRLQQFKKETRTDRPVMCVWNCPSLEDLNHRQLEPHLSEFVIFFHGSIVPARLPLSVVDALARLPENVVLRFAGFETIGALDYIERIMQRASSLGLNGRVHYLGSMPYREQLLRHCGQADVGLAFMPLGSEDINEQAMAGASNKPFDYLSCGLALLVSDLPDWRNLFVETGYGLSCNPEDPDSIASAIQWFLDHPSETVAMGRYGRERIRADWNYESQFEPVAKILLTGNSALMQAN